MLQNWVSNPGPLTYESGALPIALRGPAKGPNYRIGKTVLALAYCNSWLVIMTTQRLLCETARNRLSKL